MPTTISAADLSRIEMVYGRIGTVDYFSLLEVGTNPTEAEVRAAYHRLSKEFHPDRWFSVGYADVHAKVEEIFRAIKTAAEALATQAQIIEYRESLQMGEGGGATPTRIHRVNQVFAAEAHFGAGKELLQQQRFIAAAHRFKQALDIVPSDSDFGAYYGFALYNIPNQHDVTADEAALRPSDSDADLQFEGRQMLQRAIELGGNGARPSPRGERANFFMGRIYVQQRIPEMAKRHFEAALRCAPNSLEALRELRFLSLQEQKAAAAQAQSWIERLRRWSTKNFGWPKSSPPPRPAPARRR